MLLHIGVLSTWNNLQLLSLVLSLLLLKFIFDLLSLVITGGDVALLLLSCSPFPPLLSLLMPFKQIVPAWVNCSAAEYEGCHGGKTQGEKTKKAKLNITSIVIGVICFSHCCISCLLFSENFATPKLSPDFQYLKSVLELQNVNPKLKRAKVQNIQTCEDNVIWFYIFIMIFVVLLILEQEVPIGVLCSCGVKPILAFGI